MSDALSDLGGLILLGCGRMGGAMLEGWLEAGLSADAVQVIDPEPSERLGALETQGLTLNPDTLSPARVAVLAVKPQMMGEAAPRLAGLDTLYVSIAAGTPIAKFEELFGADARIVRGMPNTPAAIGRGISAIVGNAAATAEDVDLAERLLGAVGATVRLQTEAQMDAVTGLSGSGPAYVFHMVEAMTEAGIAAGLAPEVAMLLARTTVTGAGALMDRSEETVEALREAVTSPGGTTAAGLGVLMEALPDLMTRTVRAAADRGRELSE